jgi:hypothetical protein
MSEGSPVDIDVPKADYADLKTPLKVLSRSVTTLLAMPSGLPMRNRSMIWKSFEPLHMAKLTGAMGDTGADPTTLR